MCNNTGRSGKTSCREMGVKLNEAQPSGNLQSSLRVDFYPKISD